mgnify:CR=1 FL=1|jgi:hypothetical protein
MYSYEHDCLIWPRVIAHCAVRDQTSSQTNHDPGHEKGHHTYLGVHHSGGSESESEVLHR